MYIVIIMDTFSFRFANYSSKVYSSVVENFPAMLTALSRVQEEGRAAGASDSQKKKADKCAGIQAQIFNLRFNLTTSGCCDVYSRFSKAVCVLQVVNMLPHVKFDKFEEECREKLLDMNRTVDVTKCSCWLLPWPQLPDQVEKICYWS